MIDTNTNYSNVCLFDCKEKVREHVSSSCLNIDCDDILNALTEEIDVNKFEAWFDRNINNFKTKQNIQTYFKRAFISELNKGTFKLNEISVDMSQLVSAMRGKGIKVLSDDTCYLELMWLEIVRKGMPIEAIQQLNRKVIDYMHSGQTFADYVSLIKKSNAVKPYDIDWDKVEAQSKAELEWWTRMLNNLSLEVIPNE